MTTLVEEGKLEDPLNLIATASVSYVEVASMVGMIEVEIEKENRFTHESQGCIITDVTDDEQYANYMSPYHGMDEEECIGSGNLKDPIIEVTQERDLWKGPLPLTNTPHNMPKVNHTVINLSLIHI